MCKSVEAEIQHTVAAPTLITQSMNSWTVKTYKIYIYKEYKDGIKYVYWLFWFSYLCHLMWIIIRHLEESSICYNCCKKKKKKDDNTNIVVSIIT